MTVAGITGEVVVVGAAKYVVTVKVYTMPMALPLIRRVSLPQSTVQSAGRPCTAVDATMKDHDAVTRGATTPVAPLLRRRETRADSIGIVCPGMILIGNAVSIW